MIAQFCSARVTETTPVPSLGSARLGDSHLHRTCGAPQVRVSPRCPGLGMTNEVGSPCRLRLTTDH